MVCFSWPRAQADAVAFAVLDGGNESERADRRFGQKGVASVLPDAGENAVNVRRMEVDDDPLAGRLERLAFHQGARRARRSPMRRKQGHFMRTDRKPL